MSTYVVIEDECYRTDTIEEIAAAQQALREAGIEDTPVYATPVEPGEGGPSHPDAYPNGQTLFAD